jgi:hypothetical protein
MPLPNDEDLIALWHADKSIKEIAALYEVKPKTLTAAFRRLQREGKLPRKARPYAVTGRWHRSVSRPANPGAPTQVPNKSSPWEPGDGRDASARVDALALELGLEPGTDPLLNAMGARCGGVFDRAPRRLPVQFVVPLAA